MGLGDIIKSVFGGKSKKFESPDVTFMEDDTTGVTHTMPISVKTPTQQIIIKQDGEYLVFDSKDEIPEDLREEIEHLDELGTVDSYSVIVDGNRETYNSFDEIPEEIRQAISETDKK